MVRPFGLVEMVRTGEIAIARGARARPDEPVAARACVAERDSARGAPSRAGARCVASVTVEVDAGHRRRGLRLRQPRRAEERYFVWEQPDRDGFAIGALGAACDGGAARRGTDRFAPPREQAARRACATR